MGGVCDLSFFKASCWLVILGVENNLKKIWNILKKSSKHKSLKKKQKILIQLIWDIFDSSFSQLGSYLCKNTHVSPRN